MCYRLLFLLLFLLVSCSSNSPRIAPDVTGFLEDLGSPYSERYTKMAQLYARNVWDLQSYKGRLYIGAGNSSNLGPARNAGPVPVISWNPFKEKYQKEFVVDDEQIDLFYVFNDELFIPGHDPKESWQWGNVYRKNNEKPWQKIRNVPGAIHIYAMHQFKGVLFAGLGAIKAVPAYKKHQGAGSAVSISHDNGKNWENANTGGFRIHAFLEAKDTLIATDVVVGPEFKKYTDQLKRTDLYSAAYEFDGKKSFIRRTDISSKTLFPGINFPQFYQAKIVKPHTWKDSTVYIGGLCHNDHQFYPFGLYHAKNLSRGEVDIKSIKLPENSRIWDLLIKDGRVYILLSSDTGDSHKISVMASDDLQEWQTVLYFYCKTFARSFEFLNGDLYFGLGCEVLNPKKWTEKDLHPQSGTILKVRKGLFK